MNEVDIQYKELIRKIINDGNEKKDRTGVGTKSIFGYQMRFKISNGFPLLSLRKIHIPSIIHEMLWFIGSYDDKYKKFGNTNIRYLLDQTPPVTFWNEWPYKKYIESMKYRPELPKMTIKEFAEKIKTDDEFALEFGSIGKGYGKQWIDFGGTIDKNGINQIDYLINELKKNPDSRRLLLEAWKADEINDTLLPPCHHGFQLYTFKMNKEDRLDEFKKWRNENKKELRPMDEYNFPTRKISMDLKIRSNDCYLGQPFNIAEYALLLNMLGQIVNMIPHELIINIGDAHLYLNSIEASKEIIKRESKSSPKLVLNKDIKNIYDFRYEDIKILDYEAHPNIKVEVAV